jgi:hypothetical protein
MKKAVLVYVLCLCLTGVSSGVLYVDADTTNTTLADGTAMVEGSIGYATGVTTADDLWELRGFGNGVTIFESNADGGEDAPRLKTTVTITEAGTYDVYAYFWGAIYSGGLWRGRTSSTDDAGDLPGYNTDQFAGSSFSPMTWLSVVIEYGGNDGLNPGPITTNDASGIEDGGHFDNSVLISEGNRGLCEVLVGRMTVDAGGLIDVYIDDLANTSSGNRVWYDGVGVALVPEPATVVLLSLGALLLRRRK